VAGRKHTNTGGSTVKICKTRIESNLKREDDMRWDEEKKKKLWHGANN
jgi:hypothetical protein